MSEQVARVSAVLASRMVEAAGIEPASEKVCTTASTRLARSFFYLAFRPLNGKGSKSQPLIFARPLGASRPDYPEFASSLQVASGRLPGSRTAFIKLRKRACYRQLLVVHLICEEWNLGVLLSPLPFRRIQFAPIPGT